MKPAFTRRVRRKKTSTAPEGNFFNKESGMEQGFFAEAGPAAFFQPSVAIQRKCDKCEEEDKKVNNKMDKKKDEATDKKKEEEDDKKLHRAVDKKEEEDKKVQGKEASANASTGSGSMSYVSSLNNNGQALSSSANAFFRSRMGHDFRDVKVHTGTAAERSAKEINAKAYTLGNHIVFNEGQYQPETAEGRKLLAHELTHVMQQNNNTISRKEGEGEGETCGANIDLEGETLATYNKGKGKTVKEVKKPSTDCEGCDDGCVTVTGSLQVPYTVATTVNLPQVPADLTPCQKKRVSAAIKGQLALHEQQHVKAFKTFEGTPSLPINYTGCEGGYNSYLEALADGEFNKRKDAADKKSAALDVPPFIVNVDLCCDDKETKAKK